MRTPYLLLISVAMVGCAAMQPVAHVDREGYGFGVIGTWTAVVAVARAVIDPDRDTLGK